MTTEISISPERVNEAQSGAAVHSSDLLDAIVCGDCIEEMRKMPNESVDMVFTDPPFNVGKRYGAKHNDRKINYRAWCAEWIAECFRLLKPTGTIYLMTIPRHLEWKMPLMAQYGIFISLVQWQNSSSSNDKRRFWSASQPIMVYGKTERYKFHRYTETRPLAKSSWNKDRAKREKGQLLDIWNDIPRVYSGSITHKEAVLIPGTHKKAHPCQMPIGLPARAIRFSSDDGDVVLDPFGGSGSTAVAAKQLNRRFITMEANPQHHELTKTRILASNIESSGGASAPTIG